MFTPAPDQDPEIAARLQARVWERISPREWEYTYWMLDPDELDHDAIGGHMGVDPRTVEDYFRSMQRKFTLRSGRGVVLFATLWGIDRTVAAQHVMRLKRQRRPPKRGLKRA